MLLQYGAVKPASRRCSRQAAVQAVQSTVQLRWRRETLHACLNTSHHMQPTSVFCPTPDCHSARQGQDSVTAGPYTLCMQFQLLPLCQLCSSVQMTTSAARCARFAVMSCDSSLDVLLGAAWPQAPSHTFSGSAKAGFHVRSVTVIQPFSSCGT